MDNEEKMLGTNAVRAAAIEGEKGTADTAELSAHKHKDTSKLKKVFEDDGYNKMNEAIGRMLKRLRKEHNMSIKDVKQRLHDDYGVDAAPSTISNWESNQAHPTTMTLLCLFDLYEVEDILEALDGEPQKKRPTIEITEAEWEFIEAYRARPEAHEAIRKIMSSVVEN